MVSSRSFKIAGRLCKSVPKGNCMSFGTTSLFNHSRVISNSNFGNVGSEKYLLKLGIFNNNLGEVRSIHGTANWFATTTPKTFQTDPAKKPECGQLSALKMYEEINEARSYLEPKFRCLIDHLQSKGELNKSIQLLEELNDSPHWLNACYRVISYCVQEQNLRSTVNLMKQIKDKFNNGEIVIEHLFDEVFCYIAKKEVTDMKFGLDLLQAIKTKLHVRISRKSLDYLLNACVTVKDGKTCFVIWKEYETAGLAYNVLSYVWMYKALLASGDKRSAREILGKISIDDPHVRSVVKACQERWGY